MSINVNFGSTLFLSVKKPFSATCPCSHTHPPVGRKSNPKREERLLQFRHELPSRSPSNSAIFLPNDLPSPAWFNFNCSSSSISFRFLNFVFIVTGQTGERSVKSIKQEKLSGKMKYDYFLHKSFQVILVFWNILHLYANYELNYFDREIKIYFNISITFSIHEWIWWWLNVIFSKMEASDTMTEWKSLNGSVAKVGCLAHVNGKQPFIPRINRGRNGRWRWKMTKIQQF